MAMCRFGWFAAYSSGGFAAYSCIVCCNQTSGMGWVGRDLFVRLLLFKSAGKPSPQKARCHNMLVPFVTSQQCAVRASCNLGRPDSG